MRTDVRYSHTAYGPVPDPSTATLAATGPVLALARRLRAAGLPVSTSEVLVAVAALAAVDATDRGQVRSALRATLVKDGDHEQTFARTFDAVFPRPPRPGTDPGPDPAGTGGPDPADPARAAQLLAGALRDGDDAALDELVSDAVQRLSDHEEGRSAGHHTQRTLRRMNLPQVYQRYLDRPDADEGSDFDRSVAAAAAAAALERLRERIAGTVAERLRAADPEPAGTPADPRDTDVLRASGDDLLALRAALRPLARRLASRLGARRRRGRGGLDMRRTIRASMGTGGVPVTPHLRRRHPTRPDLVVLCDVSGSTAEFAAFTLALLHAVHQEFHRVRSFVFVDGVVEITRVLAAAPGVLDPRNLLDRKGLLVHDGRSDYHGAFGRFLDMWGDAVSPKTTVIVVGDARAHDRPPALPQTAELAHRARRLYWFNPEPRHQWDTTDSRASDYGRYCTAVFEVATLRQLGDAVAAIA